MLLLDLGPAGLLFLLAPVIKALNDGPGRGAELFLLGDILGLGGVLAVFVEPVLCVSLVNCDKRSEWKDF